MPQQSNHGLIVIGGAGHARVVAEAAESSGAFAEIILMAPDVPRADRAEAWRCVRADLPDPAQFPPDQFRVTMGIGDNALRSRLGDRISAMGYEMPPIVHKSAWVSKRADLASGAVVMAGAVVQGETRIGRLTIVNTRAGVDHDSTVGCACHMAPGATLCGHVTLGGNVFIGAGATIINGISVCSDVTVGAGSVVAADITASGLWLGVPARHSPVKLSR